MYASNQFFIILFFRIKKQKTQRPQHSFFLSVILCIMQLLRPDGSYVATIHSEFWLNGIDLPG